MPDCVCLTGIVFVLKIGIQREMLPQEMGRGSGMTCWHRLRDRQQAGVWAAVHRVLLDRLGAAGRIDWSRDCIDSAVLEELLDAVPPIRQPNGRRRERPDKEHADNAYNIPRCRRALSKRRIRVRVARKGIDSRRRLGRHRWVVERTLSWLAGYRCLPVRYERRADIHETFLTLGCCPICVNALA